MTNAKKRATKKAAQPRKKKYETFEDYKSQTNPPVRMPSDNSDYFVLGYKSVDMAVREFSGPNI